MEQDNSYHRNPHDQSETAPEAMDSIDSFPALLGFIETPDLTDIHQKLLQAYKQNEFGALESLITRYQTLGEEEVSTKQGSEYVKAQIGLIVARGIISRSIGRFDDYAYHLEDALEYAEGAGYDEIADGLGATLDEIWS